MWYITNLQFSRCSAQHSAGCLPEIREKQIMCTPFPMRQELTISHNKIYSDIVSELEARQMAMLTIGDQACIRLYVYLACHAGGFTAVMVLCSRFVRCGPTAAFRLVRWWMRYISYRLRMMWGILWAIRWGLCIPWNLQEKACRAYGN